LGDAAQALANGRGDDAEAQYRGILERDTAEGEAAYGRAATAARRLGDMAYPADPHKALSAYRQAVILDPGNPEGWNMVGLLLQRAGDMDEAAQAFERVMELGAKSGNQRVVAAATGNLGLIAQERGELERAETHLLESLTLHEELAMDEGIAAASGNLGGLYHLRGDSSRACSHWARAVGLYEAIDDHPMAEKIKARMSEAGCGAGGGNGGEPAPD
jgi:tetratricopeptide (TPR) repeat protein